MFFFFKQKTAYEMRISDWSSDVCSSDLLARADDGLRDRDRKGHDFTKRLAIESPEPVRSSDIDEMLAAGLVPMGIVGKSFRRDAELPAHIGKIGRASCRERVCQYV